MSLLHRISRILSWPLRRDTCQHIPRQQPDAFIDIDEGDETLHDIIQSNPPAIPHDNVPWPPMSLGERIRNTHTMLGDLLFSENIDMLSDLVDIAREAPTPAVARRDAEEYLRDVLLDNESPMIVHNLSEATRFLAAIKRDYGDEIFERVSDAFMRMWYA